MRPITSHVRPFRSSAVLPAGLPIAGGTVVWPNGADIAPEALYEAATLAAQGGVLTRRTGSGS